MRVDSGSMPPRTAKKSRCSWNFVPPLTSRTTSSGPERLEEAGCTVIYGSEGFKCHLQDRQLTYREGMALTRLTLLGTGNFNEKTAKLYSDFMLMTAHPGIGEDANLFFRNLSLGNLRAATTASWVWRP